MTALARPHARSGDRRGVGGCEQLGSHALHRPPHSGCACGGSVGIGGMGGIGGI